MEDTVSFPRSNHPLLNWSIRSKSFWARHPQMGKVAQSWEAFWQRGHQQAAFALIWYQDVTTLHYLLRWNEKWQMFNLVGGKVEAEDGGNIRQTMRRELIEELGVLGISLCDVLRKKTAVSLQQYSPRRGHMQGYTFHLFERELAPTSHFISAVDQALNTGHEINIWVRADEIRQLKTDDGRRISPTTHKILRRLDHL